MTPKQGEKTLAQLEACRQQLRQELTQVERQIMRARHDVRALEMRIALRSRNQPRAA
jgi:hypothetical protein